MKIFSQQESTQSTEKTSTKSGGARKKRVVPEKKSISENDIREKLAGHVEASNTAKSGIMQKNSKQFGTGFMNTEMKPAPMQLPEAKTEEEVDSIKESHLLLSDVKLNDPKDSNTQEKLKTVLSTGAFNFNPREREALDKILNGT